jgi:hypothetical protein
MWGRVLIAGMIVFAGTFWAASAKAAERVGISLIVAGDHGEDAQLTGRLLKSKEFPVDLRLTKLPNAASLPEPSFGKLEEKLALARQSYINANFAKCTSLLGDEHLIVDLLAAYRRGLAGRVLFWRVACAVANGDAERAQETAKQFAAYGLRMPVDVESVTPDVEMVLARSRRRVEETKRRALKVTSKEPGLSVAIDGLERACLWFGLPSVLRASRLVRRLRPRK